MMHVIVDFLKNKSTAPPYNFSGQQEVSLISTSPSSSCILSSMTPCRLTMSLLPASTTAMAVDLVWLAMLWRGFIERIHSDLK